MKTLTSIKRKNKMSLGLARDRVVVGVVEEAVDGGIPVPVPPVAVHPAFRCLWLCLSFFIIKSLAKVGFLPFGNNSLQVVKDRILVVSVGVFRVLRRIREFSGLDTPGNHQLVVLITELVWVLWLAEPVDVEVFSFMPILVLL